MKKNLSSLERRIEGCTACPRLIQWCRHVATEKRAAYREETYWGKPCPGFGDAHPKLLVVGLAPGAHGANRTGRVFTGDRSGDWLYRALYRAGFANQPESKHREDGLQLKGAYVTAVVHCAPPGNRPEPEERDRCLPFLQEEFELFSDLRVVVCLGSFAWENTWRVLKLLGHEVPPKLKFGHGVEVKVGPYLLLASFHPSQQNTFTKRLTEPMLDDIFHRARKHLTLKSKTKLV